MKKTLLIAALIWVATFGKAFAQSSLDVFEAEIDHNKPVVVQEDPNRQEAINCLASNMFYEARGEPDKGQIAVGLVTINRAKDGRFPSDICEVVKQKKQFSWYKPGMIVAMRHSTNTIYQEIKEIATMLYDQYYVANTYVDFVHGATHFHTRAIHPGWKNRRQTAAIGHHIFYRVGI